MSLGSQVEMRGNKIRNNHFSAVTLGLLSLKFPWEEEVDLWSLKKFVETIWTTEHTDNKDHRTY